MWATKFRLPLDNLSYEYLHAFCGIYLMHMWIIRAALVGVFKGDYKRGELIERDLQEKRSIPKDP